MAVGGRFDISLVFSAIDRASNQISKIRDRIIGVNKSVSRSQAAFNKLNKFFTGFRAELLGIGFLFGSIAAVLTGLTRQALATFGKLGGILTLGREAFLQFQAQLKSVMNQFAESGPMRDFLNGLTDLLERFDELDPKTKDVIFSFIIWGGVIATILSALAFMALGIFGIINFFIQWTIVISAVSVGLSELLGFIGLLVAVGGLASAAVIIAAIIIALALLAAAFITNFAGIQNTVFAVLDSILDFVGAFVKNFLEFFSGMFDILFGLVEGDGNKVVMGFVKMVRAILKTLLQLAALAVKIFVELFSLIVRIVGEGALNILKIMFDIVPTGMRVLAEVILGIFGTIGRGIFEIIQKPIIGVLKFIQSVAEALGLGGLSRSIGRAIDNASDLGTSIEDLASDLSVTLGARFESAGDKMSNFLSDIKEGFIGMSESSKKALLDMLNLTDAGAGFQIISDTIDDLLPVQDDLNKQTQQTFDLFAALQALTGGITPPTGITPGAVAPAAAAAPFTAGQLQGLTQTDVQVFIDLKEAGLITNENLGEFLDALKETTTEGVVDALTESNIGR